MAFSLFWADQRPTPWSLGKMVCVGRNYAEHAKELNNPIPAKPLLFIKPSTAAANIAAPLVLPQNQGECHHEAEIALLIGQTLHQVTPQQALSGIAGVGVALDLTLRDLQSQLKEKGHPWEISKAFDGSAPVSGFIPWQDAATNADDYAGLEIQLTVNNSDRQQGSAAQMLTPIPELISIISQHFTLEPGDLVLTGTPAGVAALLPGDHFVLQLSHRGQLLLEQSGSVAGQ